MSSPSRQIVLHCGAPKTGSTSLQHYFRDQEDLLRASGIGYPHRFFSRRDVDPLHRAFVRSRRPADRAEGVEGARRRLEALFRADGTRTLLVSNESLLGEPFVEGSRAFFPDAAFAAEGLQRIFAGYGVQVRYVIRDFAGYVASYYVQYVRRGGVLGFPEFLRAYDLEALSWHRPVGLLRQAFGSAEVRVYDHARLSGAPAAVVADMLQGLVGAPLPAFDPEAYRFNRSVGGLALEATRLANRCLARLPSVSPYQKGVVTRTLVMKPIALVTPAAKPRLPAELERRLSDRYAGECAALAAG